MMIPPDQELERFVRESNAIELIYEEETEPAFADHMEAARWVAAEASEGRVVHPLDIHKKLMARLLPLHQVGSYREHGVRVDTHLPPSPQMVPFKMIDLWSAIVEAVENDDYAGDLWELHYAFECIHPFVDGNGRTGRLLLNHLRLWKGMPWLTIEESERGSYFERIRAWQAAHWLEWPEVSDNGGGRPRG